jgi:toxin ParE1/3/4
MEIKCLRTTLQNLHQEAEYIAKDDPNAVRVVVQRIYHTDSLLKDSPAMGHPGRLAGTHELIIPKTGYIVPYRVRPRLRRIEILRVFHISRRPPKRW